MAIPKFDTAVLQGEYDTTQLEAIAGKDDPRETLIKIMEYCFEATYPAVRQRDALLEAAKDVIAICTKELLDNSPTHARLRSAVEEVEHGKV